MRYSKIIEAFHRGSEDKRLKLPYKNPFCKNRQKDYYKAYKNGYNFL